MLCHVARLCHRAQFRQQVLHMAQRAVVTSLLQIRPSSVSSHCDFIELCGSTSRSGSFRLLLVVHIVPEEEVPLLAVVWIVLLMLHIMVTLPTRASPGSLGLSSLMVFQGLNSLGIQNLICLPCMFSEPSIG